MGSSDSKTKQSSSLPIPTLSPPPEPLPAKPAPKTFALPEDLRAEQTQKCEQFLEDFRSQRAMLDEIAEEIEKARKELQEVTGKGEHRMHDSKDFCLFASIDNPSSRESLTASPRLSLTRSGSKPRRPSLPSPLSVESLSTTESDSLVQENVLRRMSVFSSVSQGEIYDLESLKLIVSTLIKEKATEDRRSIEQGVRPRQFPDFLVHLLLRSGKQQEEGLKHVAMLINSIKDYAARGIPCAQLFAKLFHFKDPTWYQTSLCLPRLYEVFSPLAEAFFQEKSTKSSNFHLEFDDKSRLCDVLNLLYREFASDQFSGGHLMLLLKPISVSPEDYYQFVVMQKIFVTGKSIDEIVQNIAGTHQAHVEIDALAKGFKRQLDVWLSEYDLKAVLSRFDSDEDGEVSVADLAPLAARNFQALQSSDSYCISACEFLLALEEVARERNSRMLRELLRTFGTKDKVTSRGEILEKTVKMGVEDVDLVEKLWKEARKTKEDARVKDVICAFVKYPIGEWEKSPLATADLLMLEEPVAIEELLAEAGNILEEPNEDE